MKIVFEVSFRKKKLTNSNDDYEHAIVIATSFIYAWPVILSWLEEHEEFDVYRLDVLDRLLLEQINEQIKP